MICFTVTFLIKPGCEKEVMTILREHVNPAKKEPGVGVSHAYRSRTESRRFFIYHELTDQDAFDAHRNTGNYSEFIQTNLYGMLEQESLVMDTKEGRGLPTSTIAPQRADAGALPPQGYHAYGG
jgi:quinol monooxygenase YgiN